MSDFASRKGLTIDTSKSAASSSGQAPVPTDAESGVFRKGWLEKKRSIGWNKRYFVLERSLLSYFSNAADLFPQGFVSMKEVLDVKYVPGKGNRRFDIELSGRSMPLQADTAEEAAAWADAIKEAQKADRLATHSKRLENNPRGPVSPVDFRAAWNPAEHLDQLSASAQTEFRLAFYKTAVKRPKFLRRLMAEFYTDEQVMRLLIQVLLDPTQPESLWFQMDQTPSPMSPEGPESPSPSAIDAIDRTYTTSFYDSAQLSVLKKRASACSRVNPGVHNTSLTYRRRRPLSLEVITAQPNAFKLKNLTTHPKGSRTPPPPVTPLASDTPVGGDEESINASPSVSSHRLSLLVSQSADYARDRLTPRMSMDITDSAAHGASLRGAARTPPLPGPNKTPPLQERKLQHDQQPSVEGKPLVKSESSLTEDSSASDSIKIALDSTGMVSTVSLSEEGKDRVGSLAPPSRPNGQSLSADNSPLDGSPSHKRAVSTLHTRKPLMPASPHRRGASNYQHNNMYYTLHVSKNTGSKDDLSMPRTVPPDNDRDGSNFYLTHTGYATIPKADKQNIYDWVTSDEFLQQVCVIFGTSDFTAHRLALRVLWLLFTRNAHEVQSSKLPGAESKHDDSKQCPECRAAGEQMVQFIEKIHTEFCPPVMLNYQVNNMVTALLQILVTDIAQFNEDALQPGRFHVMGKDVRNYNVWKAVFTSLRFSEFHTRRRALKDINGVLINRPHNCESILQQKGWQQWISQLLMDVPKMSNRLLEKTYLYTINIFTLLHHHCFITYRESSPLAFKTMVSQSLQTVLAMPQNKMGEDDKLAICRAFLESLLSKVRSHSNMFRQSFDGVIWSNLATLLFFASHFLFQTNSTNLQSRRSEAFLSKSLPFGLHEKVETENDLSLIEAAINCLQDINIDNIQLDEDLHLLAPEEKSAFLQLKQADDLCFYRDAFVFLPMMMKLEDLTAHEVSSLVYDFMTADSAAKRKKIFKNADDRHKDVLAEMQKAEKKLSKLIEKSLSKQNSDAANVKSLLLLGAGESGKSTLFMQMNSIYGKGYDASERREYVPIIHSNVLQASRTLIEQSTVLTAKGFQTQITVPAALEAQEYLKDIGENARLSNTSAAHIRALWGDPGIKITLAHRSHYQLACGDSVAYFFDKIETLADPNYIPSYQDMLRSRHRTTGVVESNFVIDGVPFKITDVGGQRSERKKWIHQFQDVTAVLYVAAISEYDQVIAEDGKTNRVEESLTLFEEICGLSWFRRTPIILFLNKCDLFALKLTVVPLTTAFAAFSKYKQDYKTACAFLQREFVRKNKYKDRDIYVHVTCATDTKQITVIFNAVKHIILTRTLEVSGLTV